MAIDRSTRYPGRFDSPTTARPQGAFKNRSAPGAKDGSYLERDWANDWDGFFGSLLRSAGMTPDGTPDTALASQYFDALKTLGLRQATETTLGVAKIATISQVAAGTDDQSIITPKKLPKNTALLGTSGWWRCGDTGLIRQRRRVFVGDLGGNTTKILVTWPLQFPNQCSSVVVTLESLQSATEIPSISCQYAVARIGVASCTISFQEWASLVQAPDMHIYVQSEGY